MQKSTSIPSFFCAKRRKHSVMLDKWHSVMLRLGHSKRHGNRRTQASHPTGEKGEPTHERKFLQAARIRQAENLGGAGCRMAKEKGQGRRRGVRCCSGLWSALAAMVPAGCVPVPVVGLICWRCRWAWSALAPFPLAAFQRHGWHWRCSIRAGFGRLPEGSDSPPNGSEKQV